MPPDHRDPRLHIAAVILSIHVIGITALGFEVSVPHIVVAISAAGIVDVAFTWWRTQQLVWPASGMLTGSGVALILRYVDIDSGEYWSWTGWHWFAVVAGLSVASKYLIRRGDDHLFNPSNVGLVVAFLIVGSDTIEPLDFWWAPLDIWMALAYVLIVAGGIVITRRLHLLEMAATFWVVLVAGLAVLAASGHCMIATWSVTPVCGWRFWGTLAGSPEVLIFLLFMITDPKTVPRGRWARVAFSAVLAVAAAMLIAPNTVEYGAKVGLLASLVLLTPLRSVFDRVLGPATAAPGGFPGRFPRLMAARTGAVRLLVAGAGLGAVLVLVAALIFAAGTPARDATAEASTTPAGPEVSVDVDPATIPPVDVDDSMSRLDFDVSDGKARDLAMTLAENLLLEAKAIRESNMDPLLLADRHRRLIEIQNRVDHAIATGQRPVDTYHFESLLLRAAGQAEGQTSAAIAIDATGTVDQVTYDGDGAILDSSTRPFSLTFIVRPVGERWMIFDVLDG